MFGGDVVFETYFPLDVAAAFVELRRREPGTLSKVIDGQDGPDQDDIERLFAASF